MAHEVKILKYAHLRDLAVKFANLYFMAVFTQDAINSGIQRYILNNLIWRYILLALKINVERRKFHFYYTAQV